MAEGFRNKVKKFANNPFVRYGAAAATGGIPGVAAMGARDLYKHVTNKPVGLGSLPAPHPALSVGAPDVAPPPSEVPFNNLPIPDLTPPVAPPSFGLAGLSRPVDTGSLGITHPNIPNLTPSISAPDGPVDTSSLGLKHPTIPDLTPEVAAPPAGTAPDPFRSDSFGNQFENNAPLSIARDMNGTDTDLGVNAAFGYGGGRASALYRPDGDTEDKSNWRSRMSMLTAQRHGLGALGRPG